MPSMPPSRTCRCYTDGAPLTYFGGPGGGRATSLPTVVKIDYDNVSTSSSTQPLASSRVLVLVASQFGAKRCRVRFGGMKSDQGADVRRRRSSRRAMIHRAAAGYRADRPHARLRCVLAVATAGVRRSRRNL